MSTALTDSAQALAEKVVQRLDAQTGGLSSLAPCTPSGDQDQACFRQTIASLGAQSLRRPLESAEVDTYLELLRYATEDQRDTNLDTGFGTAVGLLIEALLQDPEFLYRIETGGTGVVSLTPHQIATRMALLLWGAGPDLTLLQAATDGELQNGSDRRSVAQTMLQDERAKQQLRRFHAMWLGYRAIPGSANLISMFEDETSALVDRALYEGNYLTLFSSEQSYMSQELAAHYGFDGQGGWTQYPADSMRAGILSHGSLLAAFSKFSDTSPTQRGILVRNRLMCQAILPPPPDVDVDAPPTSEGQAVCKKDRYLEHNTIQSCANCHAPIDGIGFGLENFDIKGRFRHHDDDNEECIIDGQGSVDDLGNFQGPKQLAQLLVEHEYVQQCVVEQLLRFVLGRELQTLEHSEVQRLFEVFKASGYDFQQLLLAIVEAPSFGLKKEAS